MCIYGVFCVSLKFYICYLMIADEKETKVHILFGFDLIFESFRNIEKHFPFWYAELGVIHMNCYACEIFTLTTYFSNGVSAVYACESHSEKWGRISCSPFDLSEISDRDAFSYSKSYRED